MTDHAMKMPNLADMKEAGRLAQAGRLDDATALIRRSLASAPGNGTDPADTHRAEAHAAVLPERLRETLGQTLGQVMRGLRGVAPSIKGFGGGAHGFRPREPAPEDERFVERSFSNAAGARAYKLFVPSRRSGRRPLVVMLHGCTQSPDDFAAGTRMNALAEEAGIYVAYPHQTRAANGQKCWNWFETRDQGREHGESGIIAGLTRAVVAEHDVDPARVYIAGLSAGGAAAANIARAYPDLFAAVGIHSGLAAGCAQNLSSALMAMRTGAPGSELPGGASGFGGGPAADAARVPTIVFHGSGDETVSPKNGDAVLAQAGIAELNPSRETRTAPGGRPYTRTRYADAAGRVQVESWRVEGAGHAWSGGSEAGSYTDPRGPDASRAMLDFFAGHVLSGTRL